MMTKTEPAAHPARSTEHHPGAQPRVAVWASDPITSTGLTEMLLPSAEVFVAANTFPADVDVLVFAADTVTPEVVEHMRRAAARTSAPAVLVVRQLDRSVLMRVVECRVVAVLHRNATTGERLAEAIKIASEGGGALPTNLQGELLRQLEHLHREVLEPHGLSSAGFTSREIDILRLLAEGLGTEEIGRKLCYSERTVKNVIYAMTSRLNMRNRPQLVAHCVRAGII
ncbi:response regulator transcription factor [Saccharopolyspora sp. NPDC000359]|uniref:helix-turn-helix transcriptional regulator n=1 Tax=Saccharopolyspora sp. NPDC000359 TaxID=3154251 RepID=UPI003317F30C